MSLKKGYIYNNKWITLKCINCNKEYKILKSHYELRKHKFCSFKCYQEYRKAEFVNIKCQYCGKEKIVRKLYVDRGQYKYCSNKCKQEIREKGISKELRERKCLKCGKTFYIRPSEVINKKNRVYCSKKCQQQRIKINCLKCGKEFEILKNLKNKRFCSNACYKSFKGESSIEKIIKNYLEEKGIFFKTQIQFKNYVVDFLLPIHNLIIEADGKYWHNKNKEIIQRDINKDVYLNELGYNVIRLKEDNIKNGTYKEELSCLN